MRKTLRLRNRDEEALIYQRPSAACGARETGEALRDQVASGPDRPTELYFDGAYVSTTRVKRAKDEGWELIGAAEPSAHRVGLWTD